MLKKFFILKIFITVLIVDHDCLLADSIRKNLLPLKPANCFLSLYCLRNCDWTSMPKPGYKFITYYYNDMFKVCVPFYTSLNQKNCCSDLTNHIKTKKECEDMCGEPCIVSYKNYITEPGICTMRCDIESPHGVPNPCDNKLPAFNGSNCCPRGYQYRKDNPELQLYNQTVKPFEIRSITMKIIQHQQN